MEVTSTLLTTTQTVEALVTSVDADQSEARGLLETRDAIYHSHSNRYLVSSILCMSKDLFAKSVGIYAVVVVAPPLKGREAANGGNRAKGLSLLRCGRVYQST